MKRPEKLLLSVAAELEDGRSPLAHEWLCENNVTCDECFGLAKRISTLLKGFVAAPSHVKESILLCSVAAECGLDPVQIVAEVEKRNLINRLGA